MAVRKRPWHKAQCCAQLRTSRVKDEASGPKHNFMSMTWDNNSTEMEPRKYRESRPTGIFLDWHVQLLNSVFLMVGRDWGELENVLRMTGAHWEAQESTEMLPLKTKK